ncbi:hypothetical protein K469DRAFT_728036 [Zopfia rhizophila CBS 207.26]|uniref:Glycoside hydrolase family 2 protein n=1 Tax=Zopfia rhizophila CBS 207.26 TaxID=1314779 RepID=A0A6A6DXM1_9PEZI|nr:hypothetical protein K469DRAFT_728036 [Zopfia rhizophila CBS 207.26]
MSPDYGTFSDPSSRSRPRFRYWLPDASVDPDTVKADIKSVASIGGGGVEFLPFYEYGGANAIGGMPPRADWATYNFGTPAFQNLFRVALQSHEDNGLVMDFSLGPNQGQGVPAATHDEGLQWDLVPFTSAVPRNSAFEGVVPGWGTGELVAFVSALVLSDKPQSYQARDATGFDPINVTYTQHILQSDSLTDQTTNVDKSSGQASLAFPESEAGGDRYYRVFSFFQKRTLNKNLYFDAPEDAADTIFRNGSYVVDHFSAKGAETVARFWEEHILTNGVKDLLMRTGNYAWEDSVEVTSNISWSRSMPARYERVFGQSIKPYLPLFTFKQNNIALQQSAPGPFQCILDSDDQGARYLNNFHQVLGDGYREYLQALRNWSHNALNLKLSVQPAYNLPIDMDAFIPEVDAPECESFGFGDKIDTYRLFAGPANLAGKGVISNEIGAIPLMAYQYTIPSLLFSANRGFAGGVNQYILHGQSYTGKYYGTTWPGHTAFTYLFSKLWSDKQPSWHHGFKDAMVYMARVSHIRQISISKSDVVKYNKQSVTRVAPVYETQDLVEQGWSYTYISPDNFNMKTLYVKNGTLASEGPDWKAFLIESSENLTVNAIRTLSRYARAGLPVIVSGGSPGWYPVADDTKEDFHSELSKFLKSPNVFEVESGGVANQLSALSLSARIAVSANGTWYTTWSESDSIGYAFVFADLVDSSGEITVLNTKTPYYYDSWTGERRPVLIYTRSSGKTTIPLRLAGNQIVIIAFTDDIFHEISAPGYHVTSVPVNVIGSRFKQCSGITLHVAHSGTIDQATLSDGRNVGIDGMSVPAAFHLTNWTLIAEHWEAPENLLDASIIATKRNTTHNLPNLISWDQMPDLMNVSGVGYYTTTFAWPHSGTRKNASASGAYLSVGRVVHAVHVHINGQIIPPLDFLNAVADISPYLKTGANEIVIITPTTMWNYLRTIMSQLSTAGRPPVPLLLGLPLGPVESGLIGPVTVTPFKEVHC